LEKQKLELEKEKKDREEKEKKEKEEKEKKDKDEKEKKLEQERILAEAQLKLSQTKNEEEDPKRRPEKNISRGTQNDFIKQMGNTNGRNRRPSQLRKSVVEPQKKVEEKKSTEEKKDSDTESDESDEEEEVKPTKTVQPKVQPKTVQTPGPQPIVSKDGKEIKKIQKPAWMEKKEDEKQLVSIVAKKIQKPAWMEKKEENKEILKKTINICWKNSNTFLDTKEGRK